MSTITPTELELERFTEVVELVQNRLRVPEAAALITTEPDIAEAWGRYQAAIDEIVGTINRRMRYFRPIDYKRKPFFRSPQQSHRGRWTFYPAQGEGLLTPELAIILGEVARIAALSPTDLNTHQLASFPLEDQYRLALGEERRLETLYPLLAVAADVIHRHPRPSIEPGTGGLPLDLATRTLRNLDQIQGQLGRSRKESPIAHVNIGPRLIASFGEALASKEMMDREDLAAAFQICYDERWHTNPKTRTASGAFVEQLRDWTRREGKPELLTVLAASSDGRNRAVAGATDRTPLPVYDKMIYDNALLVLAEVVQNPRFDDARAYAMMKTNGAPQLTAVMLHGRVDLSIRSLACEQAIRHPGVDPYYIYSFLQGHVHYPDKVPHGYWRDFVLETKLRLDTIRVHGDPKQIELFEGRLKRFTTAFVEDVLQPFAEAHKKIAEAERSRARLAALGRHRRAILEREVDSARAFVRAHEFVRDPDILDVIVEGESKSTEIVKLLGYCIDAGIPITQRLMVSALQHSSREVRETAMQLLPNVRPDEVEAAAAELQERIRQDYETVHNRVLKDVIPDFEDITGILRRRSANQHYFEASDEITLDRLVEIFEKSYERDPTTIPEQFYQATLLARHAAHQNDLEPDWPDETASLEAQRPVFQGDLFGDIGDSPVGPTIVRSAGQKRSARARR